MSASNFDCVDSSVPNNSNTLIVDGNFQEEDCLKSSVISLIAVDSGNNKSSKMVLGIKQLIDEIAVSKLNNKISTTGLHKPEQQANMKPSKPIAMHLFQTIALSKYARELNRKMGLSNVVSPRNLQDVPMVPFLVFRIICKLFLLLATS